jgi:hypothetical protein
VLKVANGVSGCAAAGGCWTVDGTLASIGSTADPAAAAQYVGLFKLPGEGYVNDARIIPVAPCTGTTTAVATFRGSTYQYVVGYNIAQSASQTAYSVGPLTVVGSEKWNPGSYNSTYAYVTVTGSGKFVSDLVTGCAFDVAVLWGSIPSHR